MHIGIDVRTAFGLCSGIGYYVRNLVNQLQKIDGENKYCFLQTKGREGSLELRHGKDEFLMAPVSHENHLFGDVWENSVLAYRLKRRAINLFHGPAFMVPFLKLGYSTVSTVHDLIAFRYPQLVPLKYSIYMKSLITLAVHSSDKIIAVSESTKEDILDTFRIEDGKVTVVYLAADPIFKPIKDIRKLEAIKRKYNIKKNYMYYMGNVQPRKNLAMVIKSFNSLRDKIGKDYQLVISGNQKCMRRSKRQTFHNRDSDDGILYTGYVPREDLPPLLCAADLFLFPSICEGFGLPVLEAMSCGTPVIASNTSSIPEITEDAALLVDPYNLEEITSNIMKVLGDKYRMNKMKEMGLKQAEKFSWHDTARQTLNIYESIGTNH